MASLGSSIRSAARATSSAYRRLPIRWRLAGGSAALTLVILLRLRRDRRRAHHAADPARLQPRRSPTPPTSSRARSSCSSSQRDDGSPLPAQDQRPEPRRLRSAAQDAAVRIITPERRLRDRAARARPTFGPYIARAREHRRLARRVAPRRGARLRRPGGDPVRAPALRRAGDRQPREGVPGLRRARRRRCWRCSPASPPRGARWSRSPS